MILLRTCQLTSWYSWITMQLEQPDMYKQHSPGKKPLSLSAFLIRLRLIELPMQQQHIASIAVALASTFGISLWAKY